MSFENVVSFSKDLYMLFFEAKMLSKRREIKSFFCSSRVFFSNDLRLLKDNFMPRRPTIFLSSVFATEKILRKGFFSLK